MSKKQEELLQGQEAETILNSDVFKNAIVNLKNEYFKIWENSDQLDTDLREKIFLSIKNLSNVENHLRIMVEKGKITKSQLEKIK
jgi:hypothetical protein